ncbi:MAG TPA: family 78 glycoside hydrolase catalytic domain [Asticcacaulis sp.]|nr:family 78 glycoside hydrolase catalytic domain [Asticcacaulis sp.]
MKLNRRDALMGAGLAVTGLTRPAQAAKRADLRLTGLKTNFVVNPIGVETHCARLSWRLVSDRRNTYQAAFRIVVASSPSGLGAPDLWDSGWIESGKSFDIAYDGKPLLSRQRAWWRVAVRDSHGREAMSEPAFWEMALLSPTDWQAMWLAAENAEMRGDRETGLYWITGEKPPQGQASQVRLAFTLPADAEVTLMTIAKAPYQAVIDGAPLALPPHAANGWGPPGVAESRLTLKAGDHVLAMSIDPADVQCAMLVRARLNDGRMIRFNDLNARASTANPDGWTLPGFDASPWQTVQRAQTTQGQPLPGCGAFLLRRDFFTSGSIAKARLYVTALGAYEAYLNGVRVGDALLAPECMDFAKRVRYRVHDVTKMLRVGANAIGVMVGDGWYGSYTSPAGRFAFGDPPLRLLSQLEITYADGRTQTIASGEGWTLAPSPVTMSEIYNGEDYDARLEQPGWAEPGFKDVAWSHAAIAPPAVGALKPTISPPIRRKKTLKAQTIRPVGDGFVVDYGQNFAGWVRIRVKGRAGQKIVLKFAEILRADGHVDQANLRAARATDTYVLKGDPKCETWEPRFTYHGFRYVEISGLDQAPAPDDIVGVVIHSDLSETGHLRIGNPLIQQLWRNSLWSQRSNFMGIPTDCPQRDERLGWMGDAKVFWDAAAFNMDVAAFTERWTADIRDAQSANGAYSNVSPNTLGDIGRDQASPGWSDAGVIIPWTGWKRYGDTSLIEQNWTAMERYLAYIAAHSQDHIWNSGHGWDFGDWLSLDSKYPGDDTTPKDLIGTAVWKYSVDAMTEMARATDRTDAAETYAALADAIRQAFTRHYIAADGVISNDSQTGYILALRHDLAPETLRGAVAARLHDNIVRRGDLLATGFLGTPPSLDVLADGGYGQTVYDLLLRTAYPSWGYMIVHGATTTWERWNGDAGDVSMNSFNHYALGAVIGFVYRRIAGIDPIEPGFSRFRVAPVLDPRLASGGGDFDAMPGRISTDWTLAKDGRFSLRLTVPANAVAEVRLPVKTADKIREGGRKVFGRPELRVLTRRNDSVVIEARSGNYFFTTV